MAVESKREPKKVGKTFFIFYFLFGRKWNLLIVLQNSNSHVNGSIIA